MQLRRLREKLRFIAGAGPFVLALLLLLVPSNPVEADSGKIRISYGYGLNFLPLYVMQHDGLLEAEAKRRGLGEVETNWRVLDGGNVINDAMLAGAVDIAAIGETGFLILWSKSKGTSNETIGVSGIGGGPIWLNTRNPAVKTLADFTEHDRIALPGIKTSHNAILLEMAAARIFGDENYAKLDTLTIGMPYPEAVAAMLSDKTEIDSHFASAPFCFTETDHPGIHRVFDSSDVTGKVTAIMAFTTRRYYAANPQLISAFVAALGEADRRIREDEPEVARIYAEMSTMKLDQATVHRTIADPSTIYSAAPLGIMGFARFMHRIGLIRIMPEKWQDLFVAEIRDLPGS